MSGSTTATAAAGTSENAGSGGTRAGGVNGLESTLESVRRNASELLAGVASPPSLLRVSAGEVTIELEWRPPEVVAAPAAFATAPSVPVPTPVARDNQAPALSDAGSATGTEAGAEPGHHHVTAPIVGVFYRAPEPGAPPFVEEGARVSRGQQVGIVEAMKMMIPVEADRDGVVARVLVPDATAVEYGERLLALDVTSG